MAQRPSYHGATLSQVARLAGVHPSTASRALDPKQSGLVSPATAERVRKAADDLGYRPNLFAQGLRMSRSMSIGVLLPDITNPLFPPIIRGIEDVLGPRGYTVIFGNTDNDAGKEEAIIRSLLDRRVDGLLLATAGGSPVTLGMILAAPVPVVLVNRTLPGLGLAEVSADDRAAMSQVVRHLVSLGHRKIAEITGPGGPSTSLARHEGFRNALEVAQLPFEPRLSVVPDAFSIEAGAHAAKALLDSGVSFTAIAAANDLLAIGAMDVLMERGYNVPRDVSVTGYNDMPYADRLAIPLTTVHVPAYEMGIESAQMMLRALDTDDVSRAEEQLTVRLPAQLIARSSTGPAPAARADVINAES